MQKCFKSSQGLPLVWFSPGSLGIVSVFGSEGVLQAEARAGD